jgi:hypothetical protein
VTRLAVAALMLTVVTRVESQGVSTAGIQGVVRTSANTTLDRATVEITSRATGYVITVAVRRGRFFVQGLEPGGPYSIAIRHLGFRPQRRDGLFLALGEMREENWVLDPVAVTLESTTILGKQGSSSVVHGGTASLIDSTMLHSLPNLNRDVYDFVRLVPQISTKISLPNPGFSAGGMGFRYNNFLIGGVSERTSSGGVSGAFGGVKSVPLDAIREYQVLVAPYDVRYGDFTGALVNAVTKSGTNKLEGSTFVFVRNDRLARTSTAPGGSSYDRVQYGFTLGGPIVRDRAHFFVAPEIQHYGYPAPGPYVGQPENAQPDVPVREADLARLSSIMQKYGMTAGSAGPMRNGNPLRNLFSRLDLVLPAWNTRVTAWQSFGSSEDISLSRADTFALSSSRISRVSRSRIGAIQFHTVLPNGGGHNELLVSTRSEGLESEPEVSQPLVRVLLPSVNVPGGREPVNTGAPETGHGTTVGSSVFALKDNVTIPVSRTHTIGLGAEATWTRIRRTGVLNALGTWEFASLEDLETGKAARYQVGLNFGVAPAPLNAGQYAAYVSDKWEVTPRLSLTIGMRADFLNLRDRAPYHPGVDTAFGIRTDALTRRRIEVSPRVGFVRSLGPEGTRLRGGAGIFATRFPFGWAHTPLLSYGAAVGALSCGRSSSDPGLPPAFDPWSPPRACANGETIVENRRGDVDVLESDMGMMRILRGSVAYDRRLSPALEFSGEVLFSAALSDFVFENLQLKEPAGVDVNGRVMYGAIRSSGVSDPDLRSRFSEVISIRNEPHTRAIQLSARVEKTIGRMNGTASYTYSRVRDAATPIRVNTRGIAAWGSSRVVSGRHDDYTRSVSSNDIPHRLLFASTYRANRRWGTELSFYYVGESGRPFTFIASGDSRRGDLNSDGVATNDPIYVPTDSYDAGQIIFDGDAEAVQSQQSALESLISKTPCLRRQRGRILERNSCREPWSNTTLASVRQRLPFITTGLEMQVDVFNVLNLLNSGWGARIEGLPELLKHVGQTSAPGEPSRSIFFFDQTRALSRADPASSFQLQAAFRYRF